ncbi:helix-turn-helix transcriptional regulator, partial [Actinospica durhamensis]
ALSPADHANLAPVTAQLAATLLRTAVSRDDPASREAVNGYLVERAVLYIRSNYSRPELTAEEIACVHGVSVRHLFQQWSTQPRTLMETLLSVRLAAARSLLTQQPQLPVNVVAHRCGFHDASHFTRRFRAAHGTSPTQYRHGELPGLGKGTA